MQKLKAAIIGLTLGLALVVASAMAVFAADTGGGASLPDLAPSKAEPWTGPSIAFGIGWAVMTAAPSGENSGLFTEGAQVSGVVAYDKQWGSLVGGVGIGYAQFFGDISDGINHDIFGYGRLGLLVTPNSLVYGRLGYGRLDTDAGSIDGWRTGGGVELRVPKSPFALDLFYELGIHDTDKLVKDVDTRSHTFGARLVFRPFQYAQ